MIRIGRENERKIRQHADEGEVFHRVVGQLVVDRGGDRVPARQDRDGRAVGRRTGHGRGRRGAAGARARLDHDRLAETLAEMLGDEARDDVDVRAGREPVHHGDGTAALGQAPEPRPAPKGRRAPRGGSSSFVMVVLADSGMSCVMPARLHLVAGFAHDAGAGFAELAASGGPARRPGNVSLPFCLRTMPSMITVSTLPAPAISTIE